MGKIDPISGQ